MVIDEQVNSMYNQIAESLDTISFSENSEHKVMDRCWVESLSLMHFRNYVSVNVTLDQRCVVMTGHNGAGKTNLLEAVSLLAPGTGLRRAAYADFAQMCRQSDVSHRAWAVSADVHTLLGDTKIGTGLNPNTLGSERGGRTVRIDGETVGASTLCDYLHVSWLTPSMDGLFTGSASDRRRFLDRLIACFDPGYRKYLSQFERAMRQRNKLLDISYAAPIQFESLEVQMAETGVAIAASRYEALNRLVTMIKANRESKKIGYANGEEEDIFPWADLALEGQIEDWLTEHAAVDVEDFYIRALAENRDRDRAAKRTLIGPHRSDFLVAHGPKAMPAKFCSTGEQKALLVGLILAHTELVKQLNDGCSPILLLDEIAAHFDEQRRAELFAEIQRLGVQAWMTGTDKSMFAALAEQAQFFTVDNGKVSH